MLEKNNYRLPNSKTNTHGIRKQVVCIILFEDLVEKDRRDLDLPGNTVEETLM